MQTRRSLLPALLVILCGLAAVPAGAAASADLVAEPVEVAFPDTGIDDNPASAIVKVKNEGDETALLGALGSVANPFSIDLGATDCDDVSSLEADTSCGITVRFDPTAAGLSSGSLELPYLDPLDPQLLSVPLAGTGVLGTLQASTPNFNAQPYYFGGQTQGINVNNFSQYASQVGSISFSGDDAGSFYVAYNGCTGNTLGQGGGCNFEVGFNPSAAGTYEAQVEIANDGTVDPLVIPLTVEALNGPQAAITPLEIDFGTVEVGESAVPQQVTISNTGDFALQIQQLLVISGTPQVFPLTGDTCTFQIVEPSESCTATIGFQPNRGGERTASVFVISNTPGPVTTSALLGEGMYAPDGSVSLTSQAKVGVPLFCVPHGYRNTDTLSYRWLRSGGEIAGQTDAVYIPSTADVGASIACELTAENAVGTQVLTSTGSPAVVAAEAGPQGVVGPPGPKGAKAKAGKRQARNKRKPRGHRGKRGNRGHRGHRGRNQSNAPKVKGSAGLS